MTRFHPRPLTSAEIEIIKGTLPLLQQEGTLLTNDFYKIMMRKHPQTSTFFNKTDQKLMRQPKIMAYWLLQYAENIEDLTPMKAFIEQIVNKHVGLQIIPEHYQSFGEGLMEAFNEALDYEATDEFLEAWKTAYANFAEMLIQIEHSRNAELPWTGFRRFVVTKLVDESPVVKSVYFTPKNPNHCIMMPQPGQYVCIRWPTPEIITREYSVSWLPQDNCYRISVKLLSKGECSTFVHTKLAVGDTMYVAPPGGQFVFSPNQLEKTWTFVIGGIGITPTVPIMQKALEQGVNVELFWSNKTPEVRPFVELFREWKQIYPNFKVKEFFTNVDEAYDAIEEAEDRRLQYTDLKHIDNDANLVHLVGPRGFMSDIKDILDTKGVTNVTAEFFGPTLFLFM